MAAPVKWGNYDLTGQAKRRKRRPSTIFRTYPCEIGSPKLHGAGGVNKKRKNIKEINK